MRKVGDYKGSFTRSGGNGNDIVASVHTWGEGGNSNIRIHIYVSLPLPLPLQNVYPTHSMTTSLPLLLLPPPHVNTPHLFALNPFIGNDVVAVAVAQCERTLIVMRCKRTIQKIFSILSCTYFPVCHMSR